MLAILLITALFMVISIYFFFRAEKSQHSLLLLKRETANTVKNNTVLTKSIAMIASNHGEFAKSRLKKLLTKNQDQQSLKNIAIIKPLINNYNVIFMECLKGKGKLQSITKKCYENQDAFSDFINNIIKSDVKIQRLWASNNLIGFVSLVEALLVKYDDIDASSDSIQESGVNYCQK